MVSPWTSALCLSSLWLATAPSSAAAALADPQDENKAAIRDSVSALPSDLSDELKRSDAGADGWPTELLNKSGGALLKKLVGAMGTPDVGDLAEQYVADRFSCTPLRPSTLRQVYSQDGLNVATGDTSGPRLSGREGLSQALAALAKPFDRREFAFQLKIDRVRILSDTQAETSVIYLAMGTAPGGVVQQNARWDVLWDVSRGVEDPRVLGITVADFEELTAPRTSFSDCTTSVFADRASFDQIMRGVDYWWGRTDIATGFSLYGDYGLSIVDVNNDGREDIYICQPAGIPNLLLLQQADGTLRDVSRESNVDLLNDTANSLIADFDNDGAQDMLIATTTHVAVMRGDGRGGFGYVGAIGLQVISLSCADYDNDGLLDFYACRYGGGRGGNQHGALYDSGGGEPNSLWRNKGGLLFEDVTQAVGMDQNNDRFTLAAVWEDYDNDGDQDIYVVNDFGRNNLYRNDGGHFVDVAAEAGVEDKAAGMGASWADYNHDGRMDLYVSNMFSSAGGRITYQRKFAVDDPSGFHHFARGNTLFENVGGGKFRDVSVDAGVTMGRWAWGAQFVDLNNDGWDDIVVPNGFVTNHDSKDL